MWPIALAIFIFIGAYTYINLDMRKSGPAYEPYQAMQDRRDQIVEKNFYDWYRIKTSVDSPVLASGEETEKTLRRYSGNLETELPEELVYYIPSRPVLVAGPLTIDTDSKIEQGKPYKIRIDLPIGVTSDERFHLQAFYKEGSLHLMPSFFAEDISEAAETLATESQQIQFAVPTDPIAADEISVVLYAEGYIYEWTLAGFPNENMKLADSEKE